MFGSDMQEMLMDCLILKESIDIVKNFLFDLNRSPAVVKKERLHISIFIPSKKFLPLPEAKHEPLASVISLRKEACSARLLFGWDRRWARPDRRWPRVAWGLGTTVEYLLPIDGENFPCFVLAVGQQNHFFSRLTFFPIYYRNWSEMNVYNKNSI